MADKKIIASKELVDKVKEMDGYDLLRELVERVLQEVLEAERDEHVGVEKYERGGERKDIRSGYKPREITTGVGKLSLRTPQTRNGMSSQVLAAYKRVDQAVLLMAAEMYASGVSTRRVEKLLKATIGTAVSAQTVSKAAKGLDDAIEELRSRPLGETPALLVDARFDKVRRDGAVRSSALLVIVGIDAAGCRRVLDFAAMDSEKKGAWKELFLRLKKRGLHSVLYTVSDDHEGLKNALGEVFLGAVWNRCHTHINRNVLSETPKKHKNEVALRLKDIFNAPDEAQARARLRTLADEADAMKSGLGEYIEEIVPDGFAVFALPAQLRTQLRTTNMVERLNQEIKRRTMLVRSFPSMESYERLAGTILVRIDEEWQATGRKYLDVELLKEALEKGTKKIHKRAA
ncbi:MAG TPA: IS256 family transposase [bacterium]|nr:IS256 family transposase [bacterium]